MPEPGLLEGLQPALVGLFGDLSVHGVFQRLADSARSLAGASGAVVRLSAPDWAPAAIRSGAAGGDSALPPGALPDPDSRAGGAGTGPPDPPGGGSAVLSVPILANGADLGELVLSGKDGGAFTDQDGALIAFLAGAAGAAAWNARLYEESQRRQRWLEAAMGATADLAQARGAVSGRDLDLVAERALRASQSVLAVLAVPHAGSFRIAAVAGTVPSGNFLAVLAGRLRQPAGHAQDGQAAEWFGQDAAAGLGPVLAVRLGGGSTAGIVLVLAREEGEAYTRSDVSAAALFGAHAAAALHLRIDATGQDGGAVSADRRRIARALHDRVLPRLVGAGLGLRRLGPLVPMPRALVLIEEIARQLETAVQDLMRAAKELDSPEEPQTKAAGSLSRGLLEAAGALDGRAGLGARITIEGTAEEIPAPAEQRLLSLTAEVVEAVRSDHSRARAHLRVAVGKYGAELSLQDEAGPDAGVSPLARALAGLAARVPEASISSTASGPCLTCRVPFAPRPSPN